MIYSGTITLGSNAIAITDATNGVALPAGAMARRILIEPLRGNANAAYVGLSTVTNNGTGVAIQELAAPAAGVVLDRFDDRAGGGSHNIDPSPLFVHGTSGQKLKVTIWTI